MRGARLLLCLLATAPAVAAAQPANAPAPPPSVEDPAVAAARDDFLRGIEHVRRNEWGEALDAFQRSLEKREHATTMYNIGACQRAMGRYTRARQSFRAALARHDKTAELTPANLDDARRYLEEIDGLLVRVSLSVDPADTRVAIDGAPLALEEGGDTPRLVAGVLPAGNAKKLPAKKALVLMDPGAHVVLLSRRGFRGVARNESFTPGEQRDLVIALGRLPGQLRVTATEENALVAVDGKRIGLAPVDVQLPAGTYPVLVEADGFGAYETEVTLRAGEESQLRATLVEEAPPIAERWWFWTTLAGLAATAVVTTVVATRPEPTRPALDGGGLGWTVPVE
jgi:PEGA domain-containing protein